MSATEGTAIPADLRVLLVEDEERDARQILPELPELSGAGFRVQCRRVIDAGSCAAAGDGSWDVVPAEYALLGFGFQEALAIVASAVVNAPLIVVPGRIGERALAAALRAGASGYVSKDGIDDLGAAVRGSLAKRAARPPAEGRGCRG